MEFLKQEYWSGLPFPPPGDLPDPGIESVSTTLQVGSLPSEPPGKTKPGLSPSFLAFTALWPWQVQCLPQ